MSWLVAVGESAPRAVVWQHVTAGAVFVAVSTLTYAWWPRLRQAILKREEYYDRVLRGHLLMDVKPRSVTVMGLAGMLLLALMGYMIVPSLVVAVVLLATAVYQGLDVIRLRPLPYLVGQESPDGFLARRVGAYHLAMQEVAELPDGAWVQFLWEPRSYYSGRVVQPDPVLETWKYLCDQHDRDADGIAEALRGQGVTHILLHTAGMENIAREVPDHLSLDPTYPCG